MQVNASASRTRVCEQCGATFEVAFPSFPGRFCTKRCWYDSKHNAVDCICEHCGAAFQTYPSQIRKGGGKFCSRACFFAEQAVPLKTRYWRFAVRREGCWGWSGSTTIFGYGQLAGGHGKPVRAHRVSWVIHFGPIPAGMQVCHTCDNPPCSNPEHLFLASNQGNVDDKVAKGRQPRGDRAKHSKLTDSQVAEIRERWANGQVKQQKDLADEYGVSRATICEILSGKTRTHAA